MPDQFASSMPEEGGIFSILLLHATALNHRIFPLTYDIDMILVTRDVIILTRGRQNLDRLCPALLLSHVVYFSQLDGVTYLQERRDLRWWQWFF
jgi:hypothetical protein